MLEQMMKYEGSSEICLGEQHFTDVTLLKQIGKFAPGTHFDYATLNLNRGMLQCGNYDKHRQSARYGRPIKEHTNFHVSLMIED